MTIQKNWQRLYKFWKELNYQKLKACDLLYRKALDEDLVYTKDEIDNLKKKILDFSLIKRELNPASNKEIDSLKKELNIVLPQSFEESLKVNVGDVHKGEYIYTWLGGWNRMLDINDMIKYFLDKTKYYCMQNKDKSFQDVNNLPNEYAYWNKKWLVFLDYNQDEQYVLNLDHTSLNYGEVLSVSMEFSTIERVANSYEEWFEIATKETLTYGEILFISNTGQALNIH